MAFPYTKNELSVRETKKTIPFTTTTTITTTNEVPRNKCNQGG